MSAEEVQGAPGPFIFVASPVAHDPKLAYTLSLTRTIIHFMTNRIRFIYRIVSGCSDVSYARNQLVDDFLREEAYTHILWIDDDIEWEPEDISKMLATGKDFVAGVYRKRSHKADPYDPNAWAFNACVARDSEDLHGGLFKVSGVGMGFCLMSRKVFTDILEKQQLKMILRREWTWIKASHERGEEPYRMPEFFSFDGDTSEDIKLCKRWRDTGGDIFVLPDINLAHWGDCPYDGSLASFADKFHEEKVEPALAAAKPFWKRLWRRLITGE